MAATGRTSRAQLSVRRRRARRAQRIRRAAAAGVALLAFAGILLGLAFAGSPTRIAEGVRVAGVDVGGMTSVEARRLLERRAAALARTPVVYTAGGREWRIAPAKVGLRVNWAAAVEAARQDGDGFGPVRGFRRLGVRFFGADVTPASSVFEPALNVRVGTIARATNRPHNEAAIKLRGVRPVIVPAQAGNVLDREAAKQTIVRALTGFERKPVALPYRVDPPDVVASDLAPAAAQVRTALSAPVRLTIGGTYFRLPTSRVKELLALPSKGERRLRIAGPGADKYLARLERVVNRAPVNADFAVYADGVRVVPSKEGREVDVPETTRALLAAAVSPTRRVARLAVQTKAPARTTAEAKSMGIVGMVGSYTTIYGGEPNRIHNVRLVARLIDKHLIAPGATFSFNGTTGERTAEKGFLEAPVIINGELQTGLGGGVCQVSTTTFNAAYEAGLELTERVNHALYISHYPQGRDATVNYPDIDLKFVNDTRNWLLVRTWVGADSLTVALYGTPVGRRVETEVGELRVTGPPPVKKEKDPQMLVGEKVVEEAGTPSRATSVTRRVYDADGKLLHDDTWKSSYRAEPRIVIVGTKKKPAAKRPVRESGPVEGVRGNREVPPRSERQTTTSTATEPTTTEPATPSR